MRRRLGAPAELPPWGPFPSWVLRTNLSERPLRVLLALCCRLRGKSTRCWPSRETLARDAAPAGRTWWWRDLEPALLELQRIGAIRIHQRTGQRGEHASYIYEIATTGPFDVAPGESPGPAKARENLPRPQRQPRGKAGGLSQALAEQSATRPVGAAAAVPGPCSSIAGASASDHATHTPSMPHQEPLRSRATAKSPGAGPGENLTQGSGESPGRTPERTPQKNIQQGTGCSPLRVEPATAGDLDAIYRKRAIATVAAARSMTGHEPGYGVADLLRAQREGLITLCDDVAADVHALDASGVPPALDPDHQRAAELMVERDISGEAAWRLVMGAGDG